MKNKCQRTDKIKTVEKSKTKILCIICMTRIFERPNGPQNLNKAGKTNVKTSKLPILNEN